MGWRKSTTATGMMTEHYTDNLLHAFIDHQARIIMCFVSQVIWWDETTDDLLFHRKYDRGVVVEDKDLIHSWLLFLTKFLIQTLQNEVFTM